MTEPRIETRTPGQREADVIAAVAWVATVALGALGAYAFIALDLKLLGAVCFLLAWPPLTYFAVYRLYVRTIGRKSPSIDGPGHAPPRQ